MAGSSWQNFERGGDSWTVPSIRLDTASLPEVVVNDFSNMNGGFTRITIHTSKAGMWTSNGGGQIEYSYPEGRASTMGTPARRSLPHSLEGLLAVTMCHRLVVIWLWAILATLGGFRAGATQSLGRLCPVDEAVQIDSLVRFRDELRAAVKARSVASLQPLVDPEIMVGESQQYEVGFEAFVAHYHFSDPSSIYWADVERILSQGGVMQGDGAFCAPYFACQWGGEWEGLVVVLGDDVPAHARPDRSSPVVARLSCEVLRVARGDDLDGVGPLIGWQGVQLPSGRIGFIESGRVDSPGLMLRIARKDGAWKLILLHGMD